MTREGGRGFPFFLKFDIQVLFRPENLPWSLWKKRKKEGKTLRKPRSPPGLSSSICFHGDLGLVFNLSAGERLSLRGSSKVPIKFTSTSVYRRWRSDLRCITPSFFSSSYLNRNSRILVIISPPFKVSKLDEMSKELKTGENWIE